MDEALCVLRSELKLDADASADALRQRLERQECAARLGLPLPLPLAFSMAPTATEVAEWWVRLAPTRAAQILAEWRQMQEQTRRAAEARAIADHAHRRRLQEAQAALGRPRSVPSRGPPQRPSLGLLRPRAPPPPPPLHLPK